MDHIGHGYFLEDGSELNNLLEGNLGFWLFLGNTQSFVRGEQSFRRFNLLEGNFGTGNRKLKPIGRDAE